VVAAAAIVKDKTHLVGYYSPADVSSDELQQTVASHLPSYMIPAVWIGLDTMPQNSNGKIDKKALEALDVVVDIEAPATDAEKRMAAVWAEVLDVDVSKIGRQTSFFAIGGDSMTAIQVTAACKAAGLGLTTRALLKSPVLWSAASATSSEIVQAWPAVILDTDVVSTIAKDWATTLSLRHWNAYPVTSLQAGMLFATAQSSEAYVWQSVVPVREALETDPIVCAFKQLVLQHEILRTTFVSSASGLYQVIRDDVDNLEVEVRSARSLRDFLASDSQRGFAIGDAYFVRLSIVSVEDSRSVVLTIHHALYDGWSIPMLLQDLDDALHGKVVADRPSFRGVVDYIQAQDKDATEAFWREYLAGVTPSQIGSTVQRSLVKEQAPLSRVASVALDDIKAAAARVGLTMAELAKLAWASTLRKFTRQNDVVFGQVLANRDIPVADVDR
jgi:aryl carrier-like protein